MKTAEEYARKKMNVSDDYSDTSIIPTTIKEIVEVTESYAEQETDQLSQLYNKPRQVLKPLEDLWRKENSPDKFVLPDTTEFYKWIVKKIMINK
jgi:hypothetical protein